MKPTKIDARKPSVKRGLEQVHVSPTVKFQVKTLEWGKK